MSLGITCQITVPGDGGYTITSASEGTAGGPACTITATNPSTHRVTVSTKRKRHGVKIEVRGYCAIGDIVEFAVPGNANGSEWSNAGALSTLPLHFTAAEIQFVRTGSDNIQVDVFEYPAPKTSSARNQIDFQDVIFSISSK